MHAANAGAIMLIDGAEKEGLAGTPYDLDHRVVESASDADLAVMAKKQQKWLKANTATLDEMREALTRALEGRTA
jgi:hypothetical protein